MTDQSQETGTAHEKAGGFIDRSNIRSSMVFYSFNFKYIFCINVLFKFTDDYHYSWNLVDLSKACENTMITFG